MDIVEPENRKQKGAEAWLRVPASARPPENQRLAAPMSVDEIDEDDEDIGFLKALARQAEEEAQSAREQKAVAPRRFNVRADETLDLFRENYVERTRPRVLNNMEVDAVEMDDLLEQLSTTAAALRQRKAA
jgi:hypothetical protein